VLCLYIVPDLKKCLKEACLNTVCSTVMFFLRIVKYKFVWPSLKSCLNFRRQDLNANCILRSLGFSGLHGHVNCY